MAFYFQYNVGDTAMFGIFNLVSTGASVIGAILAPLLLKAVPSGNKAKVVIFASIVQAVFFALMFVAGTDLVWFFIFGGLAGIGSGIFIAMMFGMIPDTVEYGEVKSGIRSEGFNYAFTSLAMKWGGAAGPAALGFVLAGTGYIPNIGQSSAVLAAIAIMMTIVPAILSLATAIPFLFYKLDRKAFNGMVDEIQARRELATDTIDREGHITVPSLVETEKD
jgi:probable glucitol transport protein GutA